MATTAQEVFDMAVALMDEPDGAGELKKRALPILNVLLNELYRYSDTYSAQPGSREACAEICSLDSPVGLDDVLARTVLPYGLAAHLSLESSPAAASFFQQRYEEMLSRAVSSVSRVSEPVEELYGGICCRL